MKVLALNLEKYLTTTEYDPSPHRLSPDETPVEKRKIPLIYSCDNCEESISFRPKDFEKHHKLTHSNLQPKDNIIITEYFKSNNINNRLFLDFYCPKCKQATVFVYNGGPSGYWGSFEFKITNVLVIKP